MSCELDKAKQMARVLIFGSVVESLITFRGPLLQEMLNSGHQVFACAPYPTKDITDRLADMGVSYREVDIKRTGISPIDDIRSLTGLVNLFKEIKPDVFLGYTIKPVIYGSFAARLVGVPRIYSMITGLGYAFTAKGFKSRVVGLIAKRLYSLALSVNQKVFFQNPDDLQLFMEKGLIKIPEKAVMVNGSGVDIDVFRPVPYPESLSFLLIARLIKDKGIYEYVEAARIIRQKYPAVKFRLVGFIDENPSAISEQELQALVEAGTIEFLGRLLDVRPAIAESSVYILPSYREGTPHSVLEAMAMGRAIITTDTPGCRETVNDGENGFLVPVKEVSGLVESIEQFIQQPAKIELMGQASRRIAEQKYDVHKVNAVILNAMGLS